MATMNLDPNNIVDQMRLNTGDFIEDEPFLQDDVYLWYFQENGNSVIDGSIAALESIISYIALSPSSWEIGDASEDRPSVQSLEARLVKLRAKRSNAKVPVVIRSDRKNWDDINCLFNNKSLK